MAPAHDADRRQRRQSLAISAAISAASLYEAEVRYLVATEWAQTAEDILYRRTKHYLHMSEPRTGAFADLVRGDSILSPSRLNASRRSTRGSTMPLTLSLNTNPLVNRFAEPDDLIDTVARDLKIRDLQLTHEFINPSWPAPVIRRLTRQMAAALRAHRRARHLAA